MCSRTGKRKAAVLPVPVAARPMTSRPASAGAIAWAWIGVGASNPALSSADSNRGERPSSAKLI